MRASLLCRMTFCPHAIATEPVLCVGEVSWNHWPASVRLLAIDRKRIMSTWRVAGGLVTGLPIPDTASGLFDMGRVRNRIGKVGLAVPAGHPVVAGFAARRGGTPPQASR